MAREFAKFVEDASAIATSGRWAAMNDRIVCLAAAPDPDNAWYVQLFGSLCSQIFSEYRSIERAYQAEGQDDGPLIAWRARNLLELSVWCKSFTSSRENARRLYEDAGRDQFDLISAFEEWGKQTTQPTSWTAPLSSAKQDLIQRAADEGNEPLDKAFRAVANAAKACGNETHFRVGMKLLSKFAHPTAMQILGVTDEATAQNQKDIFFAVGCGYFITAFATLESHKF